MARVAPCESLGADTTRPLTAIERRHSRPRCSSPSRRDASANAELLLQPIRDLAKQKKKQRREEPVFDCVDNEAQPFETGEVDAAEIHVVLAKDGDRRPEHLVICSSGSLGKSSDGGRFDGVMS